MKALFYLFILLLSISFLQAQTPSNCNTPPELYEHYNFDVKEIALQRIFNQNAPYTDSIDIPQIYQDSIWDGLAAIYNAFPIIERDSVFDIHCIHWDVPYKLSRIIYIAIHEDCIWYENWQNSEINTGVPEFDTLLFIYGFTLDHFSENLQAAKFTTEQDINTFAICDSIEYFQGVNYAHPEFEYGDGNQIIYQNNEEGIFYSFKIGYQGCPVGCQSHYTYHFQVFNDCSVDYLGYSQWQEDEYPPLPDPKYCNITPTLEIAIQHYLIYPNPAIDYLYIKNMQNINQNFCIEVFSITGEKIISIQTRSNQTEIDITNLTSGIYFIRLRTNENNTRTFKFIKHESKNF